MTYHGNPNNHAYLIDIGGNRHKLSSTSTSSLVSRNDDRNIRLKNKKSKRFSIKNTTRKSISKSKSSNMNTFNPMMSYKLSVPSAKSIKDDEEESSVSTCTSSSSADGIERFYHIKTATSSSRNVKGSFRGNAISFSADLTKIFLLLIQPATKKFELIEIQFCTSQGTIGDILNLIPSNSTDDSLGHQRHLGLCRPTDGVEMIDRRALAKGPGENNRSYCRILEGEILTAIPEGYTGNDCKTLSRPILNHPALSNLFRRSNPLALEGLTESRNLHKVTKTSRSKSGSVRQVQSSKSMHFEIDIMSMNSISTTLSDGESVITNSTSGSFFSAFLENERYYHQMAQNDVASVASLSKNLDDIAFSMERGMVSTIGTITELVSKLVAPQDYESNRQPVTRALIKRRGNHAPKLDPLASLKVFGAFITLIISRHIMPPQYFSSPMGAKGAFICAGIFSILTQIQKQYNEDERSMIEQKTTSATGTQEKISLNDWSQPETF